MGQTPEYWYAAVTAPGREDEAVRQALERGYEAFRPAKVLYRKVYRSTRSQKKRAVEYPLMPRYVFIAVENYSALSELWALDIIHKFLGARLSGRIRPADVKRLREMTEEAPKEQQAMITREEYSVGQWCEAVAGPLLGQILKVENITGDGKRKPWLAHVTTQFFGSKQLVTLSLDSLVPA